MTDQITQLHKDFLTAIKNEYGFQSGSHEKFNNGMIFHCKVENTMTMLFKDIEVTITIHDKQQVAYLNYNYTHPSNGMNGYHFATAYMQDSGIKFVHE